MYAPRVFASMMTVLVVFAVSSYFINGSILTAFWQTVICTVIIQVGYFIGVLFLIRREKLRSEGVPSRSSMMLRSLDMDPRDEIRPTSARNFPAHDS